MKKEMQEYEKEYEGTEIAPVIRALILIFWAILAGIASWKLGLIALGYL